jgi:hypothetical protein
MLAFLEPETLISPPIFDPPVIISLDIFSPLLPLKILSD